MLAVDPAAWLGIGPALDGAAGRRLTLWGRVEDGHLVDATGRVALRARGELPQHAVGSVSGVFDGVAFDVASSELRSASGRSALGPIDIKAVNQRFSVLTAVRRALESRGYQEVDAPQLLEAAGTDPFIDPLPARLAPTFNPAVPDRKLWLCTSPEFELKRLLALGFPAVFHLGHVFRQGDLSGLHEPEFMMAEWYRVGWGARELADEVAALCDEVAGIGDVSEHTVAELCHQVAGIDVLDLQEGVALSRALGRADEPFLHAFSRLWVDRVEPRLATLGAVLVTRWPVALGMLAQADPDDARVAQRFELVVGGVELANGFAELTDPVEQRRRFEADLAWRREQGLAEMPMPERFLAALDAGLPPCAGVALGVDRLAMVAAGRSELASMLASPLTARLS